MLGTLYGISVGPGDPELITVKGLRRLQRSPIIAFPAGLNGQSGMAQRIIEPWLQAHHQCLPLSFPYTQDDAVLVAAWAAAAAEVLPHLQAGRDVCFVSEGDVSLYSTFSYLAHFVRAAEPGVVVTAIPGVCSPLTAAAVQALPLTLQHQKLCVLPALYDSPANGQTPESFPENSPKNSLEQALDWADVVVLMKIGSVYKKVWPILRKRGLLENSYVVERATWPDQRVYADLSDRPDLQLPYFSILVINVHPLALLETTSALPLL